MIRKYKKHTHGEQDENNWKFEFHFKSILKCEEKCLKEKYETVVEIEGKNKFKQKCQEFRWTNF